MRKFSAVNHICMMRYITHQLQNGRVINYSALLFKASLISISNFSSFVGAGGAAGAATSFLRVLFTALTIRNNTNATIIKVITLLRKLPYLTPAPQVSSLISSSPAFSSMGESISGVIISSTSDFTMAPKAAPIITPIARSNTLPLSAKSLNYLAKPISCIFRL